MNIWVNKEWMNEFMHIKCTWQESINENVTNELINNK